LEGARAGQRGDNFQRAKEDICPLKFGAFQKQNYNLVVNLKIVEYECDRRPADVVGGRQELARDGAIFNLCCKSKRKYNKVKISISKAKFLWAHVPFFRLGYATDGDSTTYTQYNGRFQRFYKFELNNVKFRKYIVDHTINSRHIV